MKTLRKKIYGLIICSLCVNSIIAGTPYDDLISSHIPDTTRNVKSLGDSLDTEIIKLLRFIYFSRVSYLSGSDNNAILTEFPGAIIETTAKTNTRYFIHSDHKEKQIILAIRGSNNIKNWLLNLEFWMKDNDWFNHKVHRGFLKIAKEIYDSVKDRCLPGYRITLTGHSMGGAVATMIGAHLNNLGHEVEVITFAQPRITNNSGARALSSLKLTRIVIEGDVVNLLPPFNYAHFGDELILQSERYSSESRYNIHRFDQEPELYLPLVKLKFGDHKSQIPELKSQPSDLIKTQSLTFYNSYVPANELAAVHSLNQYFKAIRAKISIF